MTVTNVRTEPVCGTERLVFVEHWPESDDFLEFLLEMFPEWIIRIFQ